MVKVRSFKGYLANQQNAHKIISPPYDVLDTEEAKAMTGDNDMFFLHLEKPEIDLPEGTNLYDQKVYEKGRENLEKFIHKGYLVEDTEPRMYIYMQGMGESKQYGIVALASIEDYESGVIKKHELTI
jgi:uncharacterized protein (DUF1015 family)